MKRKTEFKLVKLHLKFDLVSHHNHGEGIDKYIHGHWYIKKCLDSKLQSVY